MDLCETEKGHYIPIELPGVDEKDIEIELIGDKPVVHGKKCFEETSNQQTKGYHICEHSYGEFYRSVLLETIVDAGLIDARLSNGVLRAFVPKVKEQSVPAKKIAHRSTSNQ